MRFVTGDITEVIASKSPGIDVEEKQLWSSQPY